MDHDWIQRVDNNWVLSNIHDLQQCYAIKPYIWDAQGFAGVLSFADFYIALQTTSIKANPNLDKNF